MRSRWDSDVLGPIARYFQARTGVNLDGTPGRHARTAISRTMAAAGFHDPLAFLAHVRRDRAAFDALVDALTVGESYFFRDQDQIDAVARELLPEVTARAARGGPLVAIWSAGCSTGEEPYSIAMMLAERGALDASRIVATDLSTHALAFAREARYGAWSLRGAGADRARRWLRETPEGSEVTPRLRSAVSFRELNLATDVYPSSATGTHDVDVIFCRNVLIYFDEQTVARVAERLFAALRPGGWLVTGPSDPPLKDLAPFEVVMQPEGVFYRHADEVIEPRPAPVTRKPRATDRGKPRVQPPPHGDRRLRAPPPSAASEPSIDPAIRELADRDPEAALDRTLELLRERPLDLPAQHLRATLLLALGRPAEAEHALRELLTIDPCSPLAHFLLADLEIRRGDRAAARRSLRIALREARRFPPDAVLPHADRELAGRLATAAEQRLATILSAGASGACPGHPSTPPWSAR